MNKNTTSSQLIINRLKKRQSSSPVGHFSYQYQHTHPQHKLTNIYEKSRYLLALEHCFHQHLQPKWRENVRVGNYQSGKLSLVTASGTWSTVLHCQKQRLIRELKQQALFTDLVDIECLINPTLYTT